MSVFYYQAVRDLAPGSTLLDQQAREFRLVSFRQQTKAIRKQNTSISGNVESILYRRERIYNCQTELIVPRSPEEARIQEFIGSTLNGETFQFDRYGTLAEPDNIVQCYLVSTAVTAAEQGKTYHRYSFVIRET